jgi:Protein of unknown function (DUF4232)
MTAFARISRPAVAGAALATAAMLAAGCGSSSSAASPATTVTVTATPTPSTSASPGVTGTSSTSPGGAAPCSSQDLGLKLGLAQGTAGSVYQVLVFTNVSNATCTLYGYPGVSLGAGHPVTQVGLAAKENPSPPRELVTLAPGGKANATLQIVDALNYPASRCGPVKTTWIQVFPPNQTTPIYLAYKTTGCSKPVRILTVNVMQPGSGGSG